MYRAPPSPFGYLILPVLILVIVPFYSSPFRLAIVRHSPSCFPFNLFALRKICSRSCVLIIIKRLWVATSFHLVLIFLNGVIWLSWLHFLRSPYLKVPLVICVWHSWYFYPYFPECYKRLDCRALTAICGQWCCCLLEI